MRLSDAERAENKSSPVLFIRTRAEERSDLVEDSSNFVELSSASVIFIRTRAEESSPSVLFARTRADESSVKFTMETNPP